MMRKYAAFICLLGFISCTSKDKIPSGVLKPDKMQAVLWDVIRADALTTEMIKKDSAKNAGEENSQLQKEIFLIHKITKNEFEKSYNYYQSNPGKLKLIMDSMVIQVQRNKDSNLKARPEEAQ